MTDVVIIGAGPAGLTLGCYLAQAGVSCLIVEKGHHPRPHVGESLMPATVPIFREIGFLDVIEAAGFPQSEGVVYHTKGRKTTEIAYAEFPQADVGQAYTYHVDRSRLDLLLMKHAESLGCKILQGAPVRTVLFDTDETAVGVRVALGDQSVDIPAKVVVDAGGRTTRIGRQLDLRHEHPVLSQFALHAWLEGVDRGKRRTDRYTHVFFIPDLRGWAWQAPINDTITSIGLVADKRVYQESELDVDEFFVAGLDRNDALRKATADARLINDIKGDANYSYRLDRVCGNGWLAIGDAALFIDPVFSSGVSVALHTARFAAERIETAIRGGDVGRTVFLPYEERVQAGAAIWDDFIRLFYRLLPSFTHLLESTTHREALLRMIQGDIQPDTEASVLAEMRSLVRAVEEADDHPWKGELMELPYG